MLFAPLAPSPNYFLEVPTLGLLNSGISRDYLSIGEGASSLLGRRAESVESAAALEQATSSSRLSGPSVQKTTWPILLSNSRDLSRAHI